MDTGELITNGRRAAFTRKPHAYGMHVHARVRVCVCASRSVVPAIVFGKHTSERDDRGLDETSSLVL